MPSQLSRSIYRKLVLVSIIAVAGCGGYTDPNKRTLGEITDDSAIQSLVKSKLIRDPNLSGWRINTEVHKGVVSLFGRVESEAVKARATEIARSAKGVKAVDNRMVVAPR